MKRIFVSSSFSEPGVEAFLTQLLAALNVQDLDAIVYRGIDDDRIEAGEIIKERNSTDIKSSDLVIVLVSFGYCKSQYCCYEAKIAVTERRRRNIPILVASWPTAPQNLFLWPVEVRELLVESDGSERMYLRLGDQVDAQERAVKQLTEDVCNTLGVRYDSQPDPVGRMQLIKRTRGAVQTFPPTDTSRIDGDLRLIMLSLRNIHLLQEREDLSHQGACATIAAMLDNVREICEGTLGPRTAGFLYLGTAVFWLQEARISKDPSNYRNLCDRVRALVEKALKVGDLYTQRDAYVVLGNLELENDRPEEALKWHLDASRVSLLIESADASVTANYEEVRKQLASISWTDADSPKGISAYVMFDNLMKCHVRLMHAPKIDELERRTKEWRTGVSYSEPEHFSRYGSLLIFGFAFAGHSDRAAGLLKLLESADDGYTKVHLQTWRILIALVLQGLLTKVGAVYRNLREPTEWLSSCSYHRRVQSPREVALINAQAGQILRIVASAQHGLIPLGRAIEMFPFCIRLRVERAMLLLSMGKKREANADCNEAITYNATTHESVVPFDEAEGTNATLYAQGAAFWLLGQKNEAQDRFRLSQASFDQQYEVQLPSAFGAARP